MKNVIMPSILLAFASTAVYAGGGDKVPPEHKKIFQGR